MYGYLWKGKEKRIIYCYYWLGIVVLFVYILFYFKFFISLWEKVWVEDEGFVRGYRGSGWIRI